MSDGKTTLETTINLPPWNQDLIFSVLSDPIRRAIIVSLARKGPQTAAALAPAGPGGNFMMVRLNRVVKTLAALREAGLVVIIPNPGDGRKQMYSLAPGMTVTKTETGCLLDFSFGLLRL
ncbi:MAG: hypothetical protein JWM68_5080 [Verrucomicrobiales bacterium]|nr:hypothetical protein [Verrucomicrobiales bacterium]